MHWVLQKGVLKQRNFRALVDAVDRAKLPYSVVAVPHGELRLVPEVDPSGPVIVSGAAAMAQIARHRRWRPGSFLNQNFDFTQWQHALGDELLNPQAKLTTLRDLTITTDTFIRPTTDTKEFDGRVFDSQTFQSWKADNSSLLDLVVLSAPKKSIYREYRLFMIDDEVITGSQYMQAGHPYLSEHLDPEVLSYAARVAGRWQPAEAFVMDVALTPGGYKIVEFNNINSCGFYKSNVNHYVMAMESRFR